MINKYQWNETLKFSWGHILTFLALIFISYIAYMGDFYTNGGNFLSAALKVFVIDFILLAVFLGAQILKGTDVKFNKCIVAERILIILTPIVFVLAMIPYNHFWTVFSERDVIENKFNIAIDNSKGMFDDYNTYSDKRIGAYDSVLTDIIAKRHYYPAKYKEAGFNGKYDKSVKEDYVNTLKLQLLSNNTDQLIKSAKEWINEADEGATVWNAFLVGNIDMIVKAIDSWNAKLQETSDKLMSNEPEDTKKFMTYNQSYNNAMKELKELKKLYTSNSGFSFITLWTAVILFLMLLCPYLLQMRNLRANGIYSLIPHKDEQKNSFVIEETNNVTKQEENDNGYEDNVENKQDGDNIFNGTF